MTWKVPRCQTACLNQKMAARHQLL